MADPVPTRYAHDKHVKDDGGYAATTHNFTNTDGNSITVEICTKCHLLERASCSHQNCSWYDAANIKIPVEHLSEHPDALRLICDFCGIDAT